MAAVTIDLSAFKLGNAKTYVAALALIITSVMGYFGYVNPDMAFYLSTGLIAAIGIFLRMGVKKAQTGEVSTQELVAEVLAALNDIKAAKDERDAVQK